jgi:hypothetical protein
MKHIIGRMAAIALVAASMIGPAEAATRFCVVKSISHVSTDRLGIVRIAGTFGVAITDWQAICSVTATWHNVPADVCKNWVSAAMTAQATGKSLFLYFDDVNNAGKIDCATFTPWSDLYIDYLGLYN